MGAVGSRGRGTIFFSCNYFYPWVGSSLRVLLFEYNGPSFSKRILAFPLEEWQGGAGEGGHVGVWAQGAGGGCSPLTPAAGADTEAEDG